METMYVTETKILPVDYKPKLGFFETEKAIKLVKDESEFPEKTRRPENKIAICQALTLSRRFGYTMGIMEEDHGCPGASIAYGWKKLIDESLLIFY